MLAICTVEGLDRGSLTSMEKKGRRRKGKNGGHEKFFSPDERTLVTSSVGWEIRAWKQ
jgi:hypothetical protein